MPQFIVVLVIIALLVAFLASSIKIIHQQKIGLVERLGKFNRRLTPGPHLVIPIIDRVQYNLDMREQVVPIPAAGSHHRGQPDGEHRLGHLLPDR